MRFFIFYPMPIIQNQPNIDNSPWYDLMEEKAMAWNMFASQNNINVSGFYNATILTFKIRNRKLKISGIRQNSNVGSIFPTMNQVSEKLTVIFETPINSQAHYLRIRKNRFWNRLIKLLKFNKELHNYLISYNDEKTFTILNKMKIFEFDELIRLRIN